jgi:queuine tRNA-ribosyltransferase
MLGPILLTAHNLTYYQDLMRDIREAIEAGRFEALRAAHESRGAGPDDRSAEAGGRT